MFRKSRACVILTAVLAGVLSFILYSPFKQFYYFHDLIHSNSSKLSPSPITTQTLSTNCTFPPLRSCTFYAGCLEPVFNCGSTGYPIGFGEKFCTKFSLPSNTGRLTPRAVKWMYATMHCLQMALVPMLEGEASRKPEDNQNSCNRLEKEAFKTHAPCYLSSGLCTLTPKDWIVIIEIVNLKTLFESWDAFEGSIRAAEGCIEFFAWALEHRTIAWMSEELRDFAGLPGE